MTTHPADHTPLVINWIGWLSVISIVTGAIVIVVGYASGELMVTSGGVAGISGLVGFLGGRATAKPGVNDPDKVQTTTVETKLPDAT